MKEFPKFVFLFLMYSAAVGLVGCATNKIQGDKDLLDFLQDGVTTKEEALLALGEPWGVYEKETVYTYRLAGDSENGYRLMIPYRGWKFVDYSLLLIFDEREVLKKHSLVPVK